uniref:Uncharacterized protein n=1 Tax=Brassica oleracea TaxID=3712 RepID=A0A3P6DBN5_BRAOL|nr:unnamed protein product [Brassica oleracea]
MSSENPTSRVQLQVKRLFLVGPVRHIRQQIEFCFLVRPMSHIRRQSSTLVVSLGHPQPFVSLFVPSVLLPHGSSPYLSLPVECLFLRVHQVVSEPLNRHEKPESRRLAAKDWFVDPENQAQDSLLVTRRPLSYDLGPIFDEEAQLETIEQSDHKETKEAAKEELFQISTRTHFDDIFERYSHYSQPDPYILCFETLK